MGSRRVPDRVEAKRERFRHLTVERFTSDPSRAIEHSRSRNSHVATVLAYMALLKKSGAALSQAPIVTCEAADPQFFKAPDGMQAAHLLPGQIKIDDRPCWSYLSGEPARLLENLFAYVEPLHPNFNKADRAAEMKGLTDAFAETCREVLTMAGEGERTVPAAYSQYWVSGARAAFEAAIQQKRGKPTPPPLIYGAPGTPDHGMILNMEERESAFADEAVWNVFEQLSILDYYKASLDDTPRELAPEAIRAIVGPAQR